ncbi:MAG TPA: hypothetical protein VNG89_22495 [Vicinamibacterales bacterium]|nr:hypothetical protein [Vicinamibacterales bacterium]
MRPSDDKIDVEVDTTLADVGSEGGSPGDVEVAREHGPATGSEADETWRPTDTEVEAIPRDETGKGRRSP